MTLGVDSPICVESGVSADLPVEGINSNLSVCLVRAEKHRLSHEK